LINDYLVYVALAVTITAIPGPAVILTIQNSIKYGLKNSIAGILGNFIAMITIASISALGLSGIVLASSTLFTTVKFAGCIYLIYLGIRAWRAPLLNNAESRQADHPNTRGFFPVFKEGVWVGMSNPKAIAFFTALFPQFIDHSRAFFPQFLTLTFTIEGISFCILSAYAILSSKTADYLHKESSMHFFHKLTGGAFIGFGVALLYEK
jgi:threonine/homoserine/homoserine lactone efflux protein